MVCIEPQRRRRPAVAQRRPGESARVVTPLDDDEFVAVAEYAQTSGGPANGRCGKGAGRSRRHHRYVTKLLIAGLPVLLVVVAVTT